MDIFTSIKSCFVYGVSGGTFKMCYKYKYFLKGHWFSTETKQKQDFNHIKAIYIEGSSDFILYISVMFLYLFSRMSSCQNPEKSLQEP